MSNLEIGLTIWSIYSMLMWWYWEKKCRSMRTRIAELEAEVERLTVDGIHTCHDHCQRPMCVLRRENEELRKRLEEMSDEHRNN